tara:strand:- start:191 stop:1177 length:987 start_codon:yes stop_codon:yes gene_type:complete
MRGPISYFRGVRNPEAYHGHGVNKKFFEGWYLKIVSADLTQRWALIPGIFRGLDDDTNEAFIQVLDGSKGRSWYHRYPIEEFRASNSSFGVQVGRSKFSEEGIEIDIPDLQGEIKFSSPLTPWPVSLREPGVMGWFGLIPFMECFHGVVSFGHNLEGSIKIEGRTRNFSGGRGYIEKDWGRSFPGGYVWLHSNHLADSPDSSFIGSVAIIPWLGGAFRGFIVGLRHSGRLYRFTTYNRTKEEKLEITDSQVNWRLKGPDGTLELHAKRVQGGVLRAPIRDSMHRRVEETLNATIHIVHTDPRGRTLLETDGQVGGLEVFGDTEKLLGL